MKITNEVHDKLMLAFELTQSQKHLSSITCDHFCAVTDEDRKKLQQAYNLILEVKRNYEVEVIADE